MYLRLIEMHKIFLKNSVKQSNGVESFFFQCTIKGEEKREKNASIFFFICASKHIMFSESTE